MRGTKKDFWEYFGPFVAVLEKAGVRHITGDIVADATFFRGPPNGAGWTAEDLTDDYSAEISALTLEDNYADLRVAPGANPGDPCALTLLQPDTGLMLDNRAITIAAGGARHILRTRLLGESAVHVFGELPRGADDIVDVTVPRPAAWFATALKEALARHGIRVDGAPADCAGPTRRPPRISA